MSTCIIVQARMGSTRLPGKVLKPILGRPMLAHQLDRLERVFGLDRIVVATTVQEADNPIADLVRSRRGIALYRGDEQDVLDRFYRAALYYGASTVIRVTADCPLIDPEVVERALRLYEEAKGCLDYVSNCHTRTFPRGLDTEVFGFRALQAAYVQAWDPSDREHVTPYIRRHPEMFRAAHLVDAEDCSHLRWTVDTAEDFELVTKIYESLYPLSREFGYADILSLLRQHPEWTLINAHVEQKKVEI